MTGTVFAFLGGRDRIGTTTTAVSVATSMAETSTRVAVVDAAFDRGGIETVIDVSGTEGVGSVLRGDVTIDEAMMRGAHGVEYLPAESERPAVTDVRTHRLRRAARALRKHYDVILLDLGYGGGISVAMGLELADETILVSGSAGEDLDATAETAAVVRQHGGTIRGTVLSRVPSVQAVDTVAVTDRLRTDLLAVVPEDDAVQTAASTGQSLLRHDPDCDAAMVYWQLAAGLTGTGGLTGPVLPASVDTGDPDPEPETIATGEGTDAESEPDREDETYDQEPVVDPDSASVEKASDDERVQSSTRTTADPADDSKTGETSTADVAVAPPPDVETAGGADASTSDTERTGESTGVDDGPTSDNEQPRTEATDEKPGDGDAEERRTADPDSEADGFDFVDDTEASPFDPDPGATAGRATDSEGSSDEFELPGFDSETDGASAPEAPGSEPVENVTTVDGDAESSGDGGEAGPSGGAVESPDVESRRESTHEAEDADRDPDDSAGSEASIDSEPEERPPDEPTSESLFDDPDPEDDGTPMFDGVSPDPESLLDEDDEIDALFEETMEKVTGQGDDEE